MRLRLSLLLFVTVIFGTLLSNIRIASAAPATGSWIDMVFISYDGAQFTDVNPYDSVHEYARKNGGCVDKIYADPGNPGSGTYVDLEKSQVNGDCFAIDKDGQPHKVNGDDRLQIIRYAQSINLTSGDRSKIGAYGVDEETLKGYINPGWFDDYPHKAPLVEFKTPPANDPLSGQFPNRFYAVIGIGQLYAQLQGNTATICFQSLLTDDTSCEEVKLASGSLPNINDDFAPDPPGGGGDSSTKVSCENNAGPLGWILCKLVDGLRDATEWMMNNVIVPWLRIDPLRDETRDSTFRTWSNFRILANIALVIAMLVAVFGQALGGGMIDAYTAKKMMPRILIAAILINLSFYIVGLAVDATNIVARGITGLLLTPFNVGGFTTQIDWGGSVTAGLGLAAAGGTLWALAGPGIAFLAVFVLLPALFAVLGVFATLIIRIVIMTFLIVVAPIAFALYVLPNTEQYFKKWWSLLVKTLLVYPIVMIIFAMSQVVSAIFTSQDDKGLSGIVAIVLAVLPLFLIPFAFKLSGGMIAAVSGSIQGLGKKAVEGIKGNPNDPYSLRRRTTRNLNIRAQETGLHPQQLGSYLDPRQLRRGRGWSWGQAQRRALRQAGSQAARAELEKSNLWAAAQGDSNVMAQLARYGSADEAIGAANNWHTGEMGRINEAESRGTITAGEAQAQRGTAERKHRQRMSAIAFGDRLGFGNPAVARAAMNNPYQVGFEMDAGEKGWDEANAMARRIAGNDDFQYRSIMDEFQAVGKGPAGRVDLAGNTDGDRDYDGIKAWGSGSLYEIGSGKPRGVSGVADYIGHRDGHGNIDGLIGRIANNSLDARDQTIIKEATERGVDPRIVATEKVGKFYSETTQLAQNAKGAAGDEAIIQRRIIGELINSEAGLNPFIAQLTAGLPSTPGNKADALAASPDVRLISRTYERPDLIPNQGGAGGGGGGGAPGGP